MRCWKWVGMLTLALGLCTGAPPALAQTLDPVVFDSGVTPLTADATFTSTMEFQMAAPFHLAASTSLTGLRWWGYSEPGTVYNMRIFPVFGGVPATTPLHDLSPVGSVSRTDAPDLLNSGLQDQYETALPDTRLPAGDYLMSIVSTRTLSGSPNVYWSMDIGPGTLYQRIGNEGVWSSYGATFAFQLTGETEVPAVPEPGAALLFLPALGVVALLRRRSR